MPGANIGWRTNQTRRKQIECASIQRRMDRIRIEPTSNNQQENKERNKTVSPSNINPENKTQSFANIENKNIVHHRDDDFNINIVDKMNINKEKLKNYKSTSKNDFSNPQNNVFSTKNSENNPSLWKKCWINKNGMTNME